MVKRDHRTKLAYIRGDGDVLSETKKHSRTSMLCLFALIVVIENSCRMTCAQKYYVKNLYMME